MPFTKNALSSLSCQILTLKLPFLVFIKKTFELLNQLREMQKELGIEHPDVQRFIQENSHDERFKSLVQIYLNLWKACEIA